MNRPEAERLNKVLAQLGFGSRRSVDVLIAEGRAEVNGQVATVGQRVLPSDELLVDGKPVTRRPITKIVLAFNKPKGVTTTKKDPFAKVTVMDFLPPQYQHLYPVGRLDRDSRGLLLLTNDGDLALQLEHPRYGHTKEYQVEVVPHHKRSLASWNHDLERLSQTIVDDEAQTKPVTILKAHFDTKKQRGIVTLELQEGKKRQIRRLFSALGYLVTDLLRTHVNTVTLANLPEGEYRLIDPNDLRP